MRINYVFLALWITLNLPPSALGQQSILVMAVIAIAGSVGMLVGNRTAILAASGGLLLLIVWGKIAADIYGLSEPDSALLLFQFMLVIFLMEASTTALILDSSLKQLEGKNDDLSSSARVRLMEWARVQLFSLAKLTVAASGLSLGLLILGSIVSVSVNQIAFSGVLVLAAVVAIFILLTYRREPELRRRTAD
ncbi:hypothetical protein E6H12_06630 [Candidatus Bathyarchaeota archaeon]|nr:MAG: hypothetical protein E6H12_06630 [Candidatus Bathyarchaeota archaeon]